MAKTKKEKKEIIDEYVNKLADFSALYVLEPKALTPNEATILRKQLRAEKASFNIIKNTLFLLALDKSGIEHKDLDLTGENAVILTQGEPTETAKIVYEFFKEHENGVLKGGYLEKEYLSQDQVETLATLPSKEQMLAMTIGTIAAPLTGFVYALQANISSFITVLKNMSTSETS